jgi:hypothetical protein
MKVFSGIFDPSAAVLPYLYINHLISIFMLVVVALLTSNLPLLSIVLRPTVTATGTFPLLFTMPIIFSLPLESTKDSCFVILIGLLIAAACAVANEGNCSSRTESVRILT